MRKITISKPNTKTISGNFEDFGPNSKIFIFLSGLPITKKDCLYFEFVKLLKKQKHSSFLLNYYGDISQPHTLEQMTLDDFINQLKAVLDYFKKYKEIIIVGHSFGAFVALYLLSILSSKLKHIKIILWDPMLLPISNKDMKSAFLYDKKRKSYVFQNDDKKQEYINKQFYSELKNTSINKTLRKVLNPITIIGAEKGALENMECIYQMTKHNNSTFFVIKNADHLFSEKKMKNKLFNETLKRI